MLKKFWGAVIIILLTIFSTQEVQAMQIKISIGGKTFDAILEDNPAAQTFNQMLPLEITMNELNGNEKYFRLGKNLPANDTRVGNIHAGDLMLWSSNTVVLFYKNFSTPYSYTRLGKIINPAGLIDSVGRGNISVRFWK